MEGEGFPSITAPAMDMGVVIPTMVMGAATTMALAITIGEEEGAITGITMEDTMAVIMGDITEATTEVTLAIDDNL